jgi:hypothetical protein
MYVDPTLGSDRTLRAPRGIAAALVTFAGRRIVRLMRRGLRRTEVSSRAPGLRFPSKTRGSPLYASPKAGSDVLGLPSFCSSSRDFVMPRMSCLASFSCSLFL